MGTPDRASSCRETGRAEGGRGVSVGTLEPDLEAQVLSIGLGPCHDAFSTTGTTYLAWSRTRFICSSSCAKRPSYEEVVSYTEYLMDEPCWAGLTHQIPPIFLCDDLVVRIVAALAKSRASRACWSLSRTPLLLAAFLVSKVALRSKRPFETSRTDNSRKPDASA